MACARSPPSLASPSLPPPSPALPPVLSRPWKLYSLALVPSPCQLPATTSLCPEAQGSTLCHGPLRVGDAVTTENWRIPSNYKHCPGWKAFPFSPVMQQKMMGQTDALWGAQPLEMSSSPLGCQWAGPPAKGRLHQQLPGGGGHQNCGPRSAHQLPVSTALPRGWVMTLALPWGGHTRGD